MKNILLIYDDHSELQQDNNYLYNEGYFTLGSGSVEEALVLIKIFNFDCAILCIHDRDKQHQAIQKLKEEFPQFPIIASVWQMTANRVLDLKYRGCVDVIPRPIMGWDLVDFVKKFFHEKPTKLGRVSVNLDSVLVQSNVSFPGVIEEVSSNGLTACGYFQLKTNQPIQVRMTTPNGAIIKMIVTLKWQRRINTLSDWYNRGKQMVAGFQISEISQEHRQTLLDVITAEKVDGIKFVPYL